MGEIQKHAEQNGNSELAKARNSLYVKSALGFFVLYIALAALIFTLHLDLTWLAVSAIVIFLAAVSIPIYLDRPKKLPLGTKALITKNIWVSTDPNTFWKMNLYEELKSPKQDSQAQKLSARDLVKLPEGTTISILGYSGVPTCKFQVLEGEHSGGVYYGPTKFITEETTPRIPS